MELQAARRAYLVDRLDRQCHRREVSVVHVMAVEVVRKLERNPKAMRGR